MTEPDRNRSSDDPAATQHSWAPATWFDHLFRTQVIDNPSSYFSYATNGYQLFRHERLTAFLEGHSREIGRGRVLDIGCATGHLTHSISTQMGFARSVGIDFVQSLIERASTSFPDIEFKQCTLPWLPFDSGEFDLVVASEVLYYLTGAGRAAALEEICRVLNKGGHLLFSTNMGEANFPGNTAIEYIRSMLDIVTYRFDHQKLYHLITEPACLASRLQHLLETEARAGTPDSAARLKRIEKVAGNRFFRLMLRMFCRTSEPLVRSKRVPAVIEALCGAVVPWFTRSNITILARKTRPC